MLVYYKWKVVEISEITYQIMWMNQARHEIYETVIFLKTLQNENFAQIYKTKIFGYVCNVKSSIPITGVPVEIE